MAVPKDPGKLKDWIENGPRAADLKRWWTLVFTPHMKPREGVEYPDENNPKDWEPSGKFKDREGQLTPDAVYEINKIIAEEDAKASGQEPPPPTQTVTVDDLQRAKQLS